MNSAMILKSSLGGLVLALALLAQPCFAAEAEEPKVMESIETVSETVVDGLLPSGPLLTTAQVHALEVAEGRNTAVNASKAKSPSETKAPEPKSTPTAVPQIALQTI